MAVDNNEIDLGLVLQAAVLLPCQPDSNCFVVEGHVPGWWTSLIGEVRENRIVEIKSLALLDFLVEARQLWKQPESISQVPFLFEVSSNTDMPVQIQAIAGKQYDRCFLVLRNLAAIDDLLQRSIRSARSELLEKSREKLQHTRKVATITADRDEAKRLEQVKSRFLANMSHEVRTPLTTILGMASMAQSTTDSGKQQEYLGSIVGAANRLLRLSNDILDLSRIQAERLKLDHVPFSLSQLLQEFERIWVLHGDSRSLRFTLDVGDDVPDRVLGDSFRLHQVLTNLVANAMKFTEEGGVTLHVTLAGANIRFCVRDTGVGISPEQQERIFDTFTQVDESASRRHQGAGLGLAIAGNLVRLMGSEIQVSSELGNGSQFEFEIHLPGATDNSESSLAGSDAKRPPNALRVLVAEDHAVNRLIVVEVLEGEGMTVVEKENGREALEAWRKHPFDLILMDCQMPVMSGIDAIRAIRSEETSGRVPILALTAHAMSDEKDRLIDSGADQCMSKPFEPSELLALVEKLVSRSGSG